MIADLGIVFGRVLFVMMFMLNLGGILTWVERKQSAIMQDRMGANRASIRIPLIGVRLRILGLLHPLADAIKMLTKEDFMPAMTTVSRKSAMANMPNFIPLYSTK